MAQDIYYLGIFYSIGPQPGMNVVHMQSPDTASTQPDAAADELIAGWIADIQTDWLLCLSESVKILGYKSRRVNNGGGPTVTVPITGGDGSRTPGFGASGIGPVTIIGYNTGVRWRTGRIFWPACAEDDIEENAFSGDLLTKLGVMDAHFTDSPMLTTGIGAWNFGIYSPTHDTFSQAETSGTSFKPGIQNRRMKPSF